MAIRFSTSTRQTAAIKTSKNVPILNWNIEKFTYFFVGISLRLNWFVCCACNALHCSWQSLTGMVFDPRGEKCVNNSRMVSEVG